MTTFFSNLLTYLIGFFAIGSVHICGLFLVLMALAIPSIQLIKIEESGLVSKLLTIIPYSAMKDETGKPIWFFISFSPFYVGNIYDNKDNKNTVIQILCSKQVFESLKSKKKLQKKGLKENLLEEEHTIKEFVNNSPTIWWEKWSEKNSKLDGMIPRYIQAKIIDEIKDFRINQKCKTNTVILLCGEPGVGKSICALFLAKELKGSYVDTYNPTQAGNRFHNLYQSAQPSIENPLIILLDEIDIIYKNIIQNDGAGILPHRESIIEIRNKPMLNSFFDRISRETYQHVIFVLTSNKSPQEIRDETDSSFIRNGRVNLIFHLKNGQIYKDEKGVEELVNCHQKDD